MKNIFSILMLLLVSCYSYGQICPGEQGRLQWEAYFGTFDDEIGHLTALYNYPTRPDVTKTVYKTQTPINYAQYFGGRLRGFLHVDQATDVTFNITGDDQVNFYLSPDSNPDNKVMQAQLLGYASVTDHDKYESQTSSVISLAAGVDYYFEIIYAEASGGDHASIYWKTDLVNPDEWNLITAGFLKDVACLDAECPEAGTTCNDGDATTLDDQEDGFCNCKGTPATSNSCVGERGIIEGYRFEDITGGDINDLYEAPNFPGTPEYGYKLPQFTRPYSNNMDNFGSQIQSYLSVPVSGNYKFNVTGDDNTILFISSNDDPENKQAHQALVSGSSGSTQHDRYIWQSTGNIFLEADQYYYLELNHKVGTGGEHFSIFWQTPFTETDTWKRIPNQYFYDYTCEVACIDQGTTCDDGDPFTNNDMYDDNCQCTGTPCSGPDCDSPLANYVPYDKCSVTDQLDNNPGNNWLSCTEQINPNPVRGDGHWITYNLGERHELHQTHIWNYNVSGETDKGFEHVVIDYSDDGTTWTELGSYQWPLATGESGYSGFGGPDFQGIYAQYITFTTLDSSPDCKGLGKVAFTAVICPLSDTPCDDENIYTIDDKYDNNCLCAGQPIDENECEDENLTLGEETLLTDVFSAEAFVYSISKIASENVVSFVGGESVVLNPGFETEDNTLFLAAIDTCEAISNRPAQLRSEQIALVNEIRNNDQIQGLQVLENENPLLRTIKFYIPERGNVSLNIKDGKGNVAFSIINHEFKNSGVYEKVITTKKMEAQTYSVELLVDGQVEVERMTVLK